VLLFTLPLFLAYGRYFHVSGGYYLYLMASLVPFIVLACLIGSLGIMLMMRYFPTQKMYQVLSLLGAVFLAGMMVYLRFLSPEKFFGKEVSDEMIMAFVESLRVPTYKYLPSSWMTRGLTAWVDGRSGEAMWQLSYIVLAVTLLFSFFLAVSERIYFHGWCLVEESKSAPLLKRPVPKDGIDMGTKGFWGWFPMSGSNKALMAKDIKIFFRDPEQWSQIFILSALVVVYIFNIINLPLHNIVLKNVVSVLNIGLVGFVMSALVSRFVFTSISAEGKKMWSIYTAPVDMKWFLLGKFILYFPPFLGIAELLVVASNYLLQVDSYVMTASVLAIFLMTAGLVGMGLGMGAMYPMFDHDNISEVSASAGGVMFMILSLIYVGLVIVLGARPMYVHFNEQFLFKAVGGLDVIICYSLIVVLSLAVTMVPLSRGVRALRRMDI
jgi:ABC-2 type transport system permease protein